MPPAPSIPAVVNAQVELTVNGRRIGLRVSVPAGPVPPRELLPLYRGLAEHLTARAVDAVRAAGHTVSCQKGCGACCRQLVPVSALEARELVRVIEQTPEPRRTQLRERFAAARRRLEEEAPDLLAALLRAGELSPQQIAERGHQYFRLGIACPFLEDESCSIYEHRPVDCRQYLVVSPPEHCAVDGSPHLRAITPWGRPVSAAIPVLDRTTEGEPIEWVPLLLAVDFVAAHPQEPARQPGTDLLQTFLDRFTGGRVTR
jgi:Fe-S-cluster containining protein